MMCLTVVLTVHVLVVPQQANLAMPTARTTLNDKWTSLCKLPAWRQEHRERPAFVAPRISRKAIDETESGVEAARVLLKAASAAIDYRKVKQAQQIKSEAVRVRRRVFPAKNDLIFLATDFVLSNKSFLE